MVARASSYKRIRSNKRDGTEIVEIACFKNAIAFHKAELLDGAITLERAVEVINNWNLQEYQNNTYKFSYKLHHITNGEQE